MLVVSISSTYFRWFCTSRWRCLCGTGEPALGFHFTFDLFFLSSLFGFVKGTLPFRAGFCRASRRKCRSTTMRTRNDKTAFIRDISGFDYVYIYIYNRMIKSLSRIGYCILYYIYIYLYISIGQSWRVFVCESSFDASIYIYIYIIVLVVMRVAHTVFSNCRPRLEARALGMDWFALRGRYHKQVQWISSNTW